MGGTIEVDSAHGVGTAFTIELTADASERQSERLKLLGAADYLTKPLDVPRFFEIIANNLSTPAAGR